MNIQYAVIPSVLLFDSNLNSTEKILLSLIDGLDNSERGCYAGNAALGQAFNMTAETMKVTISRLRKKGYVYTLWEGIEGRGLRLSAQYRPAKIDEVKGKKGKQKLTMGLTEINGMGKHELTDPLTEINPYNKENSKEDNKDNSFVSNETTEPNCVTDNNRPINKKNTFNLSSAAAVFFEAVNGHAGTAYSDRNKANMTKINTLVADGYTPDDFKAVADFKAGWLSDAKMKGYYKPDVLLRHFRQYREDAEQSAMQKMTLVELGEYLKKAIEAKRLTRDAAMVIYSKAKANGAATLVAVSKPTATSKAFIL